MNRILLLLIPVLLFTVSCVNREAKVKTSEETKTSHFESEVHQAFLENLASLCGKSFKGEQLYRSHHGASWADRKMVMHVRVCEDDKVYIPFHIDDDHSRTWMFVDEDGKFRFKHQHLHEDGTPEEGSMYGGYADENGTSILYFFS